MRRVITALFSSFANKQTHPLSWYYVCLASQGPVLHSSNSEHQIMIYAVQQEPQCPFLPPTRPTQCQIFSLSYPLICSVSISFYDLFTFTLPCFTFFLSPQWLRFRSTVQFQYNNLTLHIALVLVLTTRLCDLQCQRAYSIVARSSYLSRQLWATYDSQHNKYRCEPVKLRTCMSSDLRSSQQTSSQFLKISHNQLIFTYLFIYFNLH